MRHLLLLTVHFSVLLVISHSTPVVGPIHFENGPEPNQDLSLVSDWKQSLFAESTSDADREIDSTLKQCYGSTGGLQPLGELHTRQSCEMPANSKAIDEIQPPQAGVLEQAPKDATQDDYDCRDLLREEFLLGKMFLWSVCNSGMPETWQEDIVPEEHVELPGYATFALYHATLSRFIRVLDAM